MTLTNYTTEDTKETVEFTAPHGRDDDRGYSLDGWDWMDAAAETHWFALSSWGKDGWDAGSWPYTIITLARGKDETGPFFGVTTYCEGDLDTKFFRDQLNQWAYITEWCRWGWANGQSDGPKLSVEEVGADREKYGRPFGDDYDGKVGVPTPPATLAPEGFKLMARRMKRLRGGRTVALLFTWEGGQYIEVAFEGCVAHDAINVWDSEADAPRIERTNEAFRDTVKAYVKGLDHEATAQAFTDRKYEVRA